MCGRYTITSDLAELENLVQFTPQREMITKLWGPTGHARPIEGTLF